MAGAQTARFGTHNAVLPKEGPMVYPVNMDFSVASGNVNQTVDLSLQVQQGFISFIQGFYVDNSLNANPLVIVIDETGQKINIPANKQAYMPAFFSDTAKLVASTTLAANLIVPIFLTNVPVDTCIW